MATPGPAVERAGRIVDLLVAEHERSLTVTEIANRLGISKATCFSILAVLAELGWVRRDAEAKTYELGPELVHVGWAAIERLPGVSRAREAMFALSAELDVGAVVAMRVDDELVVLDRVVVDGKLPGMPPGSGRRFPANPPVGLIYYAWSNIEDISDWLARVGVTSPGERDAYWATIQTIRARGYSIGGSTDRQVRTENLLARLDSGGIDSRLEAALLLADMVRAGMPVGVEAEGAQGLVDYVVAPVFDAHAQVVLTISLVGRLGQMHDQNVKEYADPLLAAVRGVTAGIGGRVPTTRL